MSFIICVFLFLVFAELFLRFLVANYKVEFPWLVTVDDESPTITPEVIDKFFRNSYDPLLGWTRRPNTTGWDKGKDGDVKYTIDSVGARKSAISSSAVVAVFGDSYVFSRQVSDNDAWPSLLSESKDYGVLNFGVGNYGVDQALLRYEHTNLPDTVGTVILGFVPETICRIQSVWKHYLEFGNTLAFKPRFLLNSNSDLDLFSNPIVTKDDLYRISNTAEKIKIFDYFYLNKFKKLQFRGLYFISFLRNFKYNMSLFGAITLARFLSFFEISSNKYNSSPFSLVMMRNINEAHAHYNNISSCELLEKILERFVDVASARGHKPLILVMPQLFDLKFFGAEPAYSAVFKSMSSHLPIIDLTADIVNSDFRDLYINDTYGGHFSAKGNSFVAEKVSSVLSRC